MSALARQSSAASTYSTALPSAARALSLARGSHATMCKSCLSNSPISFMAGDSVMTEVLAVKDKPRIPSDLPEDRLTSLNTNWARCRSEEHTSELQSLRHLVC